jgi:hypothetical protein
MKMMKRKKILLNPLPALARLLLPALQRRAMRLRFPDSAPAPLLLASCLSPLRTGSLSKVNLRYFALN